MYKVKRICIGPYGGSKFSGFEEICAKTYTDLNEALEVIAFLQDMFPDSNVNKSGTMLIRKVTFIETLGFVSDIEVQKKTNLIIYYGIMDVTDPWQLHYIKLK